jgi:DNA polymerase-1
MYLVPTKEHWACDIEADNLLSEASRIWCCTVLNCVTKEEAFFLDKEAFGLWLRDHPDAIFVGHNFLSYDCVMLNRFWGSKIPASRVVDTFVLSQLYNPSMPRPEGLKKKTGPHSLEAWGLRLKYPKGDFHDFSAFSETMLQYCRRDTRLTALLFRKLSERMRMVGFSEDGARLEHLAWNIIQNKQYRNGFDFDYQRAEGLYATLRARQEELQNEIYKLWPPQLEIVREYKNAFKKDGSDTLDYARHKQQYPKVELTGFGGYVAYDYVAFNLGSPPQRIQKLIELGWQPVKFTKKTKKGGGGNPQVDEDSLMEFAESSGNPEVLALSKWVVVYSRANMIRTWLDAYDPRTKAIHGRLFIASTLRYKHSEPNSANIPAVRLKKDAVDPKIEHIQYGEDGFWTYESRDLWTCGDPEEWSLVGVDGTGIQNRCLIHGLIKTVGEEAVADFKELALRGDIHKHNIDVLGLANKAAAKKFYYTLMMGGGGERLAADQAQFGTKMSAKEGAAKKAALRASIPGFDALTNALEKELEETGRIKLCDGTPILVPSPHMVIPYLLQGDESRLMKQALIYVDEEIRKRRLQDHVFKVADIHDEWQWKVRNSHVDEFIEFTLPCFNLAGDRFNYRIPIDGDAKVGKTWAMTH